MVLLDADAAPGIPSGLAPHIHRLFHHGEPPLPDYARSVLLVIWNEKDERIEKLVWTALSPK